MTIPRPSLFCRSFPRLEASCRGKAYKWAISFDFLGSVTETRLIKTKDEEILVNTFEKADITNEIGLSLVCLSSGLSIYPLSHSLAG